MALNLLIFFPAPEHIRRGYEAHITRPRDELSVRTVGTLAEAEAAIADTDILASFGSYLSKDFLRDAGRLKWIHSLGTGVDNIINQPSLRDDVVVTATRGIHGGPMTEAALMMMLALLRDFRRSLRQQERAEWGERWKAKTLEGRTALILGVGLIAETMAPRFKALGMRVIGLSQTARQIAGFDEVRPRSNLLAAAVEADFLISLLPLADDTRGLIGREVFAAMKPASYVVNLSRGAVIDDAALLDALSSGRIAGAALDVFTREPLPPDDPLWRAPNTLITGHLAGHAENTEQATIEQFERNLAHFRAGRVDLMTHRVMKDAGG